MSDDMTAATSAGPRGADVAMAESGRAAQSSSTAAEDVLRPRNPERLFRLLGERNIDLMRTIGRLRPRSVAALARLTGRPKASLMLTLRRLERAGLLRIVDIDGRRKEPRLARERLLVEVDLGAACKPNNAG